MGIDPGEKRLRPALPVGVDVVVDVEESLVFGGGGDGSNAAEFGGGDVPARHVDVGGVVDAPLLQAGEQIVEPVDPFRIDPRWTVAAAVVDLVVVVVDADDVEAERRQTVGQFLRLLPVGQLGVADEVRSVETDRNSRTVAEDELPFRRDDERTVLARRGVEESGEIQRAVLFDISVIGEGLPILSGGGDEGGGASRCRAPGRKRPLCCGGCADRTKFCSPVRRCGAESRCGCRIRPRSIFARPECGERSSLRAEFHRWRSAAGTV